MIRIAICDDEKIILEEVQKIVQNYLMEINIRHEIDIFEDGKELWQKYGQGISYDLIFLDINMKQMDGIALGNKIRSNPYLENNQIVYISSERNKTEELLNIRVFGFVFKGNRFKEDIKAAIKKYTTIKNYNMDFIEIVDKKGEKIKILLKEIIYFKSILKRVYVYTNQESYLIRKTLKELEETLVKNTFIRINNNIIINGNKIKEYEYKSLTMENGETFKISQTYQVKARKYFLSRR